MNNLSWKEKSNLHNKLLTLESLTPKHTLSICRSKHGLKNHMSKKYNQETLLPSGNPQSLNKEIIYRTSL